MNSQQYFNTIAPTWGAMRQSYFEDGISDIIASLVSFDDKIVVDLGSGSGFMALHAAKTARHVFAIDQSAHMLKLLDGHGVSNITTLNVAMDPIILQNESVDVVTINMALHHVENPLQLIREAYRILKPTGQFLIIDVMEHQGAWAHHEMHDIWLGFSIQSIDTWLQDANFAVENLADTRLSAVATSESGETINTSIFYGLGRKGTHNEI